MKLSRNLVLLLAPIISCCSKMVNNITPSISVDQNKIYFSTSNYTSRTSYLYSFDSTTYTVTTESPLLAGIDGLNHFQSRDSSGNLQNLYIAKYIIGQPSSVMMYNASGIFSETSIGFPQNIYDMMLANNSLYSVGYEKKEIAVMSPFLDSVILANTTVQGFNQNQSDTDNFVSILNQSDKFYAVSVGYTYSPFSVTGATLYALSSNLMARSTQTPNSWLIKDTTNGATCFDLNSTMRVSNNKVVVACNPSYANLSSKPSLFLIDVSNSTPTVTLLNTAVNSNTVITLGGLSKDKNSVFVTEEDANGDYNNPTVYKSYWLNLVNKNIVNTNGAFSVTYNNTSNSYVFSCVLNSSHQCQSNAFGVASELSNGSVEDKVKAVSLNGVVNLSGVHAINFFKDL